MHASCRPSQPADTQGLLQDSLIPDLCMGQPSWPVPSFIDHSLLHASACGRAHWLSLARPAFVTVDSRRNALQAAGGQPTNFSSATQPTSPTTTTTTTTITIIPQPPRQITWQLPRLILQQESNRDSTVFSPFFGLITKYDSGGLFLLHTTLAITNFNLVPQLLTNHSPPSHCKDTHQNLRNSVH